MRPERIPARSPVAERRPPTLARQVATAPQAPAQSLRQRLGNQGTQALMVARSSPAAIACMRVSSPSDPAEAEARSVASRVMTMAAPEPITRAGAGVQRATPAAPGPAPALAGIASSGGAPLPAPVRNFMEPRFGADFGNVRIHTGEAAAAQSARLNANAFAVGQHVFFGRGQYQPDTASGKELIAHELTHTIQQGAAPQIKRSAALAVTEQVSPHVQRDFLGIPNPREYFAGKAASIPGFTMLTVVIGYNPITNARVERSAGNILRGAIELIPGGSLITEALNNHGVFDKVSKWAAEQFQSLKDIGAALWQDIENFISQFSVLDLRDPGALWDRAKAIVTRPIERIIAFAKAIKDGIVDLIKEAILKPIAAFARTTRGYPLLCAVMGKDPITGEPVPQDPVSLMGEFMKFIGEEEMWNNMLKANAIPRAFAWFKGALGALLGFVNEIPGLFMQALKTLQVVDIILIPRAFIKLAGVFGSFAVRFVTWGASAAWNLLEIIFDVVSPGALAYIKKTGSALKTILKNPLPFVGNLVKAAKLGFINFGANFLVHLKAGLIDWLTGSLPGIYIPKAFSLPEVGKFAFSVLGLSWANIRAKLVKATSETAVKAMEAGFDIVVTLVREGPAAAWDKIKEQLSNLKDMVIGGITDFVVDMVVKKAIPKMIAMFIPGAGFISAILSIYDTIMVFVNKISKIIQVVTGFIDSIVNIAAGNIGAAATKVETTLAGLLSLAINFLAGFAGLGKVADKLMGVFAKVRAPIDKALDWLVDWIVKMAKKLFAGAKSAAKKLFAWAMAKSPFTDADGKAHSLYVDDAGGQARLMIASTPTGARAFVDYFVKSKPAAFNTENKAKITAVYGAISASEEHVKNIDKAKKANKSDDELVPMLQQLLTLNVAVCSALSALINDETGLGKAKEKYLLEGLAGTYGAIPKPKGDSFTADHQPQAAILEAAAEFDYFTQTGEMAKRAAGRAQAGFAINVHFKRHTAGRTYGGKGGGTKNSFLAEVKSKVDRKAPRAKQRQVVVGLVKKELAEDVKAMKKVVAGKTNFPDIVELGLPKKEEDKLIDEVRERINAGQAQMAAQDLDSLAN
jgi:hypothetical protein